MSDPQGRRAIALAEALGGPLLGLETSTSAASLCLAVPGAPALLERSLSGMSLPSESLVEGMAELFAEAKIAPKDVHAMVVGLGPGSFTGLRVGLATIKGLALGASVPVFGVSSLAVMAASCAQGFVATLLDARRGDWYVALYEVQAGSVPKAIIEDCIMSPVNAAQALAGALPKGAALHITGDMAQAGADLLADQNTTCAATQINMVHGLFIAEAALHAGKPDDLATLVPRYMRVSEAERQLAEKLKATP